MGGCTDCVASIPPPGPPRLQYRMHPAIREFPSLNFYGGGLKDGPGVLQDTQRPWHSSPAFQPLVLIDVKGTVRGGAAAGREGACAEFVQMQGLDCRRDTESCTHDLRLRAVPLSCRRVCPKAAARW